MNPEYFDILMEDMEDYANTSRGKAVAVARRRGLYSGILIGFLAGMTVTIYMFLYAWRI